MRLQHVGRAFTARHHTRHADHQGPRYTISVVTRSFATMLVCLSTVWIAAAQAPHTVWDGVYTAEQAVRGQAEYMKACASCHADDLSGNSTAPSLVEESFAFLWGDTPVGDLLEKTQKLMPADRPNSLPAQTYRDIVAFILQSNKFPAGDQELASDPEALRKILITAKRP